VQVKRVVFGGWNRKGKRGKDMKSIKKVLAMALALAMVVTAVPVTSAQAASTAKLSKSNATVAIGTKAQTKTVKVTTPSSWKSVKVTVAQTAASKKVAKVTVSGKTIKVKAVKKGAAKKVTVKVTGKKNGKKVSKNLKLTVKTVDAKLSISASDVTVGSTANVSVTKKVPAAATVTYTSSDEKVATVDASGVVTGVASGTATITATSDYGVTDSATINVGKYSFESVKQTKTTELVATIKGATSEIKATDFTITNTATNATVPVKTVAVDSKDATKVTITTFNDMKDGKDYNVVLDNVTRSFTATDGTVASVGLSKTEVPAGDETEVKAQSLDANGVVIGEYDITNTTASKGDVSTVLTISTGYASGAKVYLPSVGDTMKAKLTYHTGTFGTDGSETGAIEQEFTITAVDPSVINYTFEVTVLDSNTNAPAWEADSFKANTTIKKGSTKFAYFRILKDDGEEISNSSYKDYSVKSADKTKLLVTESNTDLTNKNVAVKGVSEGTSYIEIYRDGNVVGTVSVTVSGDPVATTLDIDKTNVTVVTGPTVDQKVTLQAYDQYGDKRTSEITKVECVGAPNSDSLTAAKAVASAWYASRNTDDKAATLTVSSGAMNAAGCAKGSYTFKITVLDKDNGTTTLTRSLTVTLVDSSSSVTYSLVASKSTVDTTIGASTSGTSGFDVTFTLYEMQNGGAATVTGKAIEYTLSNSSGKTLAVVGSDVAASDVVTCDAIAITGNAIGKVNTGTYGKELTVETVSKDAIGYKKNLAAGTYNVSAKFTVGSGTTAKTTYATATFTVKDDNVKTATKKWVSTTEVADFQTKTVAVGFSDTSIAKVYYDGVEQSLNADGSDIIKVVGTGLKNGGAFIDTVYAYLTVTGTNNKLLVPITVNDQITDCDVNNSNIVAK
jgi:hypothetical protein